MDEKYHITKNFADTAIPQKFIPRKLQILAISGDPQNFNTLKIPCLTVPFAKMDTSL